MLNHIAVSRIVSAMNMKGGDRMSRFSGADTRVDVAWIKVNFGFSEVSDEFDG